MSGDTKDIIGAGGRGDIPLESARVGAYCQIQKVHYSDIACTVVDWTEMSTAYYGICEQTSKTTSKSVIGCTPTQYITTTYASGDCTGVVTTTIGVNNVCAG